MWRSIVIVSWILAAQVVGADEPRPHARAHAHNDYAHDRPLLDALAKGFCSVEADVFLRDGKLLVAHQASELQPDRTLESLYLAPLRARAQQNGGHIYSQGPRFWLLIDIKSDGAATYQATSHVLEKYADVLTTFRKGETQWKAVTVVISGNRPRELIGSAPVRYAAVDGRLSDLESTDQESTAPANLLPWISDNWTQVFKWRGTGEFSTQERQKLRDIVAKAHRQQRMVRFWATPDLPAVWRELVAADVDLINTDDLQGVSEFLSQTLSEK